MSLKNDRSTRLKPGPGTCVTPPSAAVPVKGTHPAGDLEGSGTPPAPNTQGCVNAAAFPNHANLPFASSWSPSFNGCPVKRSPQAVPEVVADGQARVIGWPPWNVVLQLM